MKTLTLTLTDDKYGSIVHDVNLKDEVWIEQLEAFRKFLLAQGFQIEGRIAVVEPASEHDCVADLFYDTLHDVGWLGAVVSQAALQPKE